MTQTFSRREFERVKLKAPIIAMIKLVTPSFNNEIKSLAPMKIYVTNISASGLGFVSDEEFEVNFLVIYNISLNLNNRVLELSGKIIRKIRLDHHHFLYGFKFSFQ